MGWSSSLDWSIATRRRTMTVHRPFGAQEVCNLPEEGEVVPISDGAFVRRERGRMVVYIREWERRNNGGRPLDPNNPRDAAQIRRCMRSIDSIRSTDDGNGDERRAPCPNCSQLLQNLNARWGGPRARTVSKGASAPGKGDSTRFTPPRDPWAAAQGM